MDNLYRVVITEINSDKVETLHDELYKSVAMLAEEPETNKMTEVILSDSIFNLANKMAQSESFSPAARLSRVLQFMLRDDKNKKEDDLVSRILAGIDDEGA